MSASRVPRCQARYFSARMTSSMIGYSPTQIDPRRIRSELICGPCRQSREATLGCAPMRPEVLNPLFAEVEALKGVGPGIAKALARLDLRRAIDLAYHLPTGVIDRVRGP